MYNEWTCMYIHTENPLFAVDFPQKFNLLIQLFHLCTESKLDTSNINNKCCYSSVIERGVLSIDWSDWIFFLLFCLLVLLSFNFTEPRNISSETNMNVKSI